MSYVYRLTWPASPDILSVSVTGNFDGWSRSEVGKLHKNRLSDVYETLLRVSEKQKLVFKFILNGDNWQISDSLKDEFDEHGNQNNYVEASELIPCENDSGILASDSVSADSINESSADDTNEATGASGDNAKAPLEDDHVDSTKKVTESNDEIASDSVKEGTDSIQDDIRDPIEGNPTDPVKEGTDPIEEDPADSTEKLPVNSTEEAVDTIKENTDSVEENAVHSIEEISESVEESTVDSIKESSDLIEESTAVPIKESSDSIKEGTVDSIKEDFDSVEEDAAVPIKESSDSVEEQPAAPIKESSDLVEEQPAAPIKESSDSIKEVFDSVEEQPAVPIKERSDSVEESTAVPIKESSDSVGEQPVAPIKERSDSVEEQPAAPIKERSDSVEESAAAPIKESSDSVEESAAAPIKERTDSVEEGPANSTEDTSDVHVSTKPAEINSIPSIKDVSTDLMQEPVVATYDEPSEEATTYASKELTEAPVKESLGVSGDTSADSIKETSVKPMEKDSSEVSKESAGPSSPSIIEAPNQPIATETSEERCKIPAEHGEGVHTDANGAEEKSPIDRADRIVGGSREFEAERNAEESRDTHEAHHSSAHEQDDEVSVISSPHEGVNSIGESWQEAEDHYDADDMSKATDADKDNMGDLSPAESSFTELSFVTSDTKLHSPHFEILSISGKLHEDSFDSTVDETQSSINTTRVLGIIEGAGGANDRLGDLSKPVPEPRRYSGFFGRLSGFFRR